MRSEIRSCPRCSHPDADFRHMVWDCGALRLFWEEVVSKLSKVLGRDLPLTLHTCILGLFPRPPKRKVGNRFIDLALDLAKRRIGLTWKSARRPLLATWSRDVVVWGGAEGRALLCKESKGVRKLPMAGQWSEVLATWENPEGQEVGESGSDPESNISTLLVTP